MSATSGQLPASSFQPFAVGRLPLAARPAASYGPRDTTAITEPANARRKTDGRQGAGHAAAEHGEGIASVGQDEKEGCCQGREKGQARKEVLEVAAVGWIVLGVVLLIAILRAAGLAWAVTTCSVSPAIRGGFGLRQPAR
jgi:hypothetical protein